MLKDRLREADRDKARLQGVVDDLRRQIAEGVGRTTEHSEFFVQQLIAESGIDKKNQRLVAQLN